MRIVFAGTPAVAEPTLVTLAAAHDVVAVVTRLDAPLGRRRVLTPSPVAQRAEALGLTVIKANRLDAGVTQQIAALQPDLGVIVAYGGFVREPLLSTPRLGWINLHFSLLPRWRGAAPVQYAVMAGDEVTGASVFQLVPAMDAGAVFATLTKTIGAHQTAGNLLDSLAVDGAELVAQVVDGLESGTAVATAQSGAVTLAPKLSLDDARLEWNRPAAVVYQQLRGVTPEPGAFTVVNGQRLKILEAEPARDVRTLAAGHIRLESGSPVVGTEDVPIRLVRVQPAGRTIMPAADWWRGLAAHTPTVDSGTAAQNELVAE
ncbi:methionyl-tRNA formyltransferase [soil metagenome]